MNTRPRLPLLLAAVLLLFSIQAYSQNSRPGTISGYVFSNDSETPLYDVHVSIPELGREISTDSTGFYTLIAVQSGRHDIVFYRSGYETCTLEGTMVIPGNETDADCYMRQKSVAGENRFQYREEKGVFEGRVVDTRDQRPVPAVRVMIEETNQFQVTDRDGYFRFHDVDSGIYTVVLQHRDFMEKRFDRVYFDADRATPEIFELDTRPNQQLAERDNEDRQAPPPPQSSSQYAFRTAQPEYSAQSDSYQQDYSGMPMGDGGMGNGPGMGGGPITGGMNQGGGMGGSPGMAGGMGGGPGMGSGGGMGGPPGNNNQYRNGNAEKSYPGLTIYGQVYYADDTSKPVNHCRVSLRKSGQTVLTDRYGRFQLVAPHPGEYEVIVSCTGRVSETYTVQLSSRSDRRELQIFLKSQRSKW